MNLDHSTLQRQHRLALLFILASSAIVKLLYIFLLTRYGNYLYADTHHYFHRALAFFNGELPNHVDWDVFPMGTTVLLAACWRLMALFGIPPNLESALVLNVLLSTASVALSFHLAWKLTGRPILSLVITAFCAYFFTLIYLSGFILSEHFGQVFFLGTLCALVEAWSSPRPLRWLALAGFCWALSCHVRGSFLFAFMPIAGMLLFKPPASGRLRAITAFTLPAVLVFVSASLTLWLLTDGASYKPTGNNGGFNLFIVQCHFTGAFYSHETYRWYFAPAIFSEQPELGTYVSEIPFSDQGYYLRESLRCLQEHPGSLRRLVSVVPTMLYSRFFPEVYDIPGAVPLIAWGRHLLVLMILLAPAGYLALRRRTAAPADLLMSCAVVLWITFAEFNGDHRHLYSLSQIGFLFGLAGVAELATRSWSQRLGYVTKALAVTGLSLYLFAGRGPLALYDQKPERVSLKVLQRPITNGTPWYSLDALRFWAPLTIELGGTHHERTLELALDSNDVYELSFQRGGSSLGRLQLSLAKPVEGLTRRKVRIPEAIAAAGYDTLLLRAVSGDGRYSVGDLRFSD